MLLSSIVGIYTLLSQEIFTYQGILVYWFLLCIVISYKFVEIDFLSQIIHKNSWEFINQTCHKTISTFSIKVLLVFPNNLLKSCRVSASLLACLSYHLPVDRNQLTIIGHLISHRAREEVWVRFIETPRVTIADTPHRNSAAVAGIGWQNRKKNQSGGRERREKGNILCNLKKLKARQSTRTAGYLSQIKNTHRIKKKRCQLMKI